MIVRQKNNLFSKLGNVHLSVYSSLPVPETPSQQHNPDRIVPSPSTPSSQHEGRLLPSNSKWANQANRQQSFPSTSEVKNVTATTQQQCSDSDMKFHLESFKTICAHLSTGPENPELFVHQFNLCLSHYGYPTISIPDVLIKSSKEATSSKPYMQASVPNPHESLLIPTNNSQAPSHPPNLHLPHLNLQPPINNSLSAISPTPPNSQPSPQPNIFYPPSTNLATTSNAQISQQSLSRSLASTFDTSTPSKLSTPLPDSQSPLYTPASSYSLTAQPVFTNTVTDSLPSILSHTTSSSHTILATSTSLIPSVSPSASLNHTYYTQPNSDISASNTTPLIHQISYTPSLPQQALESSSDTSTISQVSLNIACNSIPQSSTPLLQPSQPLLQTHFSSFSRLSPLNLMPLFNEAVSTFASVITSGLTPVRNKTSDKTSRKRNPRMLKSINYFPHDGSFD